MAQDRAVSFTLRNIKDHLGSVFDGAPDHLESRAATKPLALEQSALSRRDWWADEPSP